MLSIDQTCSLVSNGWHQVFKVAHPGLPSSEIPSVDASRTADLCTCDESLKGLRASGGVPRVRYVVVSLSQSAMIPRDLNSSFCAATS